MGCVLEGFGVGGCVIEKFKQGLNTAGQEWVCGRLCVFFA